MYATIQPSVVAEAGADSKNSNRRLGAGKIPVLNYYKN